MEPDQPFDYAANRGQLINRYKGLAALSTDAIVDIIIDNAGIKNIFYAYINGELYNLVAYHMQEVPSDFVGLVLHRLHIALGPISALNKEDWDAVIANAIPSIALFQNNHKTLHGLEDYARAIAGYVNDLAEQRRTNY